MSKARGGIRGNISMHDKEVFRRKSFIQRLRRIAGVFSKKKSRNALIDPPDIRLRLAALAPALSIDT